MRADEVISLNDALKSNQYIKLLRSLKAHAKSDINVAKIKNQVIRSWSKGMRHRKHFDDLLSQIHINLSDLID